MECAWTDYIGSTEDCLEVGCYEGLYEYYQGIYQNLLGVNAEDPSYTVEEFTITSLTPTFTFILDRSLLLEDPELGEIGIQIRVGLGEEFQDSDVHTIDSVTQLSETEYAHVVTVGFSYMPAINDLLAFIFISRNFAVDYYFSGVKVPNGELRTFCPLYMFYAPI